MKIKMSLSKNINNRLEKNEAVVRFSAIPTRILHDWFGDYRKDMIILKKMKRFLIRMKSVEASKNSIMSVREHSALFG